METSELKDDAATWESLMLLHSAALKEMNTKLEILNDEFIHMHHYNPIEHIKSRIKTPESIVKKLKKDGHEATIENMSTYINDIAGVRIICSFTSDIPVLAKMIAGQSDIEVISVKDYFKTPKENGYKSYHMVVSVPVFLSDRQTRTKVEIQIRTIAMDFWASLEHKIYYKFEGNAPHGIRAELKECADIVAYLDKKMLSINESVKEFAEKDSTRDEYLDDYTSPVLDLEPISYIIEDSGSNNTDGKEKKKKRWKAGGR